MSSGRFEKRCGLSMITGTCLSYRLNTGAKFLEVVYKYRQPPVAEWLRSLTSVLLIIRSSHRCGFAPRTGHEFICETSQVLLAGVSGGFSPGTPVFAPPTD